MKIFYLHMPQVSKYKDQAYILSLAFSRKHPLRPPRIQTGNSTVFIVTPNPEQEHFYGVITGLQ